MKIQLLKYSFLLWMLLLVSAPALKANQSYNMKLHAKQQVQKAQKSMKQLRKSMKKKKETDFCKLG